MMNMFNDPKIKDWLDHQAANLAELHRSAVFAAVVTPNWFKSPECMLQIGAALCLNKPIVLVVFDEVDIPPKLAKVADKIIRGSQDDPESVSVELAAYCRSLP